MFVFSYRRHLRREMNVAVLLTFYPGGAYLAFIQDQVFLATNVYPLS